ncbi:MAG: hypothetical protein V2A73_20535, partial [Pseudomonadota bacterium]
ERAPVPMTRLAATGHGCLLLAGGHAQLLILSGGAARAGTSGHSADTDTLASAIVYELASSASAIAFQGSRVLVATGEQVRLFDEKGKALSAVKVDQGVSAVGLIDEGRLLVAGYDAGDLELLPVSPGTARPAFSLEETIPAPVERIVEGPRQTLVVGYTSGDLGIWSLETGKRLRHFKLHGPVVHLFVDRETRRLYAATEVGDYRAIDLAAFYQDYCELMADVWSNVPVVWQAGVPAMAPPSARHRCAAKPAANVAVVDEAQQ